MLRSGSRHGRLVGEECVGRAANGRTHAPLPDQCGIVRLLPRRLVGWPRGAALPERCQTVDLEEPPHLHAPRGACVHPRRIHVSSPSALCVGYVTTVSTYTRACLANTFTNVLSVVFASRNTEDLAKDSLYYTQSIKELCLLACERLQKEL